MNKKTIKNQKYYSYGWNHEIEEFYYFGEHSGYYVYTEKKAPEGYGDVPRYDTLGKMEYVDPAEFKYIFLTKKSCINFIIQELNDEIKVNQEKINKLKSCIT
jgi:hypothetical protein